MDETTAQRLFASLHSVGVHRGVSLRRQPVHTVYGGAHLFTQNTITKLSGLALSSFTTYATDPGQFTALIDPSPSHTPEFINKLWQCVAEKLSLSR